MGVVARTKGLLCVAGASVLGMTTAGAAEVALYRSNPEGVALAAVPVTVAVPFPRGELTDASRVSLLDENGRALPLQARVTSRWWGFDDSVQTLLLTFLAETASEQLRLVYGEDAPKSAEFAPLRVTEDDERIEVVTGPLRAVLSKRRFRLFEQVSLDLDGDGQFSDEERVIEGRGELGLRVGGASSALAPATLTVEESGPVRAVVRIEGKHGGDNGAPALDYVVCVRFYAGLPLIEIDHTFIQDTGEIFVDAPFISLDLPLTNGAGRLVFGIEDDEPVGLNAAGHPCSLLQRGPEPEERIRDLDNPDFKELYEEHRKQYQSDYETQLWNGPGPDLREFVCQVRQGNAEIAAAQRAAGSLQFYPADAAWMLSAGMQYFADLHPKEIALENGVLSFYLYPRSLGKPLDLHIGCAKTHTIALWFGPQTKSPEPLEYVQARMNPVMYFPSPEWFCASKVWGDILPRQPGRFKLFEAMAARRVELDFVNRRANGAGSGMMNFGDIPWGNNWWANMETAYMHALFIQFIRTGERRYYDLFEQAVRHFRDVDVNHADIEGWDYGLWIMPGYLPEAFCKLCAEDEKLREQTFYWTGTQPPGKGGVHRHSYRHYANADGSLRTLDHRQEWKRGKHYSGSCDVGGHGWFVGLLDHYLLTGDRRSLNVAKMCGEWVLQREREGWGRDNWRHVNLMALYRATGDQRYLEQVRRAIEHIYDDRASVVQRLREQKEKLMSPYYTILQFVRRYHRCTGDAEVARMYVEMLDPWIDNMLWTDANVGEVFEYIRDYRDSRCHTDFADLAYAYLLTGDRSYVDRSLPTFELYIPCGDHSTSLFASPEYLYVLDRLGVDAVNAPPPQLWYARDAHWYDADDRPATLMVYQWAGFRVPTDDTTGVVRVTTPSGKTMEQRVSRGGLEVYRFDVPADGETGPYRVHAEAEGLHFNFGCTEALQSGAPARTVEGKFGKAALLSDCARLTYPLAGNIRLQEGTIEMWIRPEWSSPAQRDADVDYHYHYLIDTRDREYDYGFQVYLYDSGKKGSAKSLHGGWGAKDAGDGLSAPCGWQAGQWHHVAFSWKQVAEGTTDAWLYVDGKLVASEEAMESFPPRLDESITLGTNTPATSNSCVRAALDEVRISDLAREPTLDRPEADEHTLFLCRFDQNGVFEADVSGDERVDQ